LSDISFQIATKLPRIAFCAASFMVKNETPPSPAFLWLAHNSFVESRIVKTSAKELDQHDEIKLQNHRHYLAGTRRAFE
jgi:hypothetical protein